MKTANTAYLERVSFTEDAVSAPVDLETKSGMARIWKTSAIRRQEVTLPPLGAFVCWLPDFSSIAKANAACWC